MSSENEKNLAAWRRAKKKKGPSADTDTDTRQMVFDNPEPQAETATDFVQRVTEAAHKAYKQTLDKIRKTDPKYEGPNMTIKENGNSVTVTIGPMTLDELKKFGDPFFANLNNNLNPQNTVNQKQSNQQTTQAAATSTTPTATAKAGTTPTAQEPTPPKSSIRLPTSITPRDPTGH